MESGGVIPTLSEGDRKKSSRPLISIGTLMCRIEEENDEEIVRSKPETDSAHLKL